MSFVIMFIIFYIFHIIKIWVKKFLVITIVIMLEKMFKIDELGI